VKAVGLYRYLPITDSESLLDLEIEKPVPGSRDLLVRVKAVSVNPVDTKVRAPKEAIESSPRILGWDVAGVVEEAGEGCRLFKPGDEVYYAGSIVRPGGDSEFHLVDERIVGRKPTSLDFAEAAALPLTTLTAWESLFDRLGISQRLAENQGKRILVIGSAGGVGSIATQLANQAGLTVIGTATRPESINWTREHGAHYVIDYRQLFPPQLQQSGSDCVDYILCLNSTDAQWENMVASIAPEGKICSIVETDKLLNLMALQQKSATFAWEFVFTRSMYQTPDMIKQHDILNAVADLVDAGKIRTTLSKRLTPINAATLRQAHAKVEEGRMIGKVVIENFPSAENS
jgi:NADPH:quinone reductase